LNRIDEIIIFDYLGPEEIKQIVDLEINRVQKRLTKKNIKIAVSEKAKQILAKKGFDPHLGARPLKRVIQKLILDPLALKIVTGEVKEGAKVMIEANKNEEIIILTANLEPKKKLSASKK